MFCGISTSATPWGALPAARNAWRRWTSIVLQSRTRLVYLAKLPQISEPYASWNDPRPSSVEGCWPARQTTALFVIAARVRPVIALVSPQPAVTQHTPGLAVLRAHASAA